MEEIKPLTNEQIQKLKQEHGEDLTLIRHVAGNIVLKPPTKPVWARFTQAIGDDRKPDGPPLEILCVACCVHPTSEELSQYFVRYPGLPDVCAVHITRLAKGFEGDADVVKL